MSFEEDPVADFIARERSELAGLDDDDFGEGDKSAAQTNGEYPKMNGFNGEPQNQADEDFFGGGGGALADDGSNIPPTSRQEPTPPPVVPQVPRIEPEKIRKWREDQKNRLEKKDAQEEKEKQKWRDQAKRELEEWYKNRNEQMEKTKKTNKITEQEFIRERDADRPGQEWERIARLCEFNPKSAKNTKDVSRMRSLLLQMKTKREQ